MWAASKPVAVTQVWVAPINAITPPSNRMNTVMLRVGRAGDVVAGEGSGVVIYGVFRPWRLGVVGLPALHGSPQWLWSRFRRLQWLALIRPRYQLRLGGRQPGL